MKKWIIYSLVATLSLGASLGAADKKKSEKDSEPVQQTERKQIVGQNNGFTQKKPNKPIVGERREVLPLPPRNTSGSSKVTRPEKDPQENTDRRDRNNDSGRYDRNDRGQQDRNDRDRHDNRNPDWGNRNDRDRHDHDNRDWRDRNDRDRHDRDRYDRDRYNRYDRDRYQSTWHVYPSRRVPVYPSVVYHRSPSVVLFDGFGWGGSRLELSPGSAISDLGRYRRGGFGSWDDCLSSIRIRGDVTVVLYTQPNFRGDRLYLQHDVRRFGGHEDLDYFLRRVSSIRVLYGRQYGHGYSTWTSVSHRNRNAGIAVGLGVILDQLWDDDDDDDLYESVRNTDGGYYENAPAMVTIYDQPYYRGNSVSLEPEEAIALLDSVARGSDGTWDDRIASIRVQGGAALYVYSDSDFYGEASIIDDSIGDLRDSPVYKAFAYDISSLIVKSSE